MPTITDLTKVKIQYQDDSLQLHNIVQRKAVQEAVGNTLALPNNTDPTGRPAGWRLRAIYGRFIDGNGHIFRKRCVIGHPTNPRYVGTNDEFSCDGVTWTIEGRVGELRHA